LQISTIADGIWAWLTILGRTIKVQKMPDGSTMTSGLDRQTVDRIVNSFVGPVVAQFVMAHDWDFACDEDSDTTVADTADYTLRGNNMDCRDIINVRYDSDLDVLDRLNVLSNDRRKPAKSGSGVYGWTWFKMSTDGFPVITIHNTPTEAKTFKYRYRKKDITIGDIPDYFDYVVNALMKARFQDDYYSLSERFLKEAIHKYRGGGDDYETVRLNPTIEAGNIRRCQNQGGA